MTRNNALAETANSLEMLVYLEEHIQLPDVGNLNFNYFANFGRLAIKVAINLK
jgi:hypothetical protein